MNDEPSIREGQLLAGPLFSEPMQVETVRQSAPGTWILGLAGSRTQQYPGARHRLLRQDV